MPKENQKKNFQDVVPKQRTIRNIELPSRRGKSAGSVDDIRNASNDSNKKVTEIFKESKRPPREVEIRKQKISEPEDTLSPDVHLPETPHSYQYTYDETPHSSKKGLYFAVGIFVIAVAFGVSAFFKSAVVTITPRSQDKVINQSLIAKKDALGSELGYQIVTVSKSVTQKITASGEQKVTKKARGTIVIYNNESTTSQKLIATTRFQTADGLVFRLVSPATIPGKQTKAGKVIPGSVEVVVEADVSGDKYNIGLVDFTLPAFANDPKFTTIYGRSKTAMSGGFDGVQKTIASKDLSQADTSLTGELKDVLLKDITSQIPENFVLYSSGVSYNFEPISQKATTDPEALVEKRGTAYAVIFDKSSLSRAITTRSLPEAGENMVSVLNLDSLVYTYATSSDSRNSSDISFILSGDAHFVWMVDMNTLKTDILGLSKKQAGIVITNNTMIQEGWIKTQPFWNVKIPSDPSKVTMVNTLIK